MPLDLIDHGIMLEEDSKRIDSTVDIWQIPLAVQEHRIQLCRGLLSEDENERADRFYFEKDRMHFISGRSAMRKILSKYVGVSPKDLIFSYSSKGKPRFHPGRKDRAIEFNLSHSSDYALLAVAKGRYVGVDIEFVDHGFASEEIAKRFFSPREVSVLQGISPGHRAEAFFSCWTRKEAYVKALGMGLSLPLDSFDVAFGPGVSAALLRAGDCPDEVLRWSMYNIKAPRGYIAALVIEGRRHHLRQCLWEPEF